MSWGKIAYILQKNPSPISSNWGKIIFWNLQWSCKAIQIRHAGSSKFSRINWIRFFSIFSINLSPTSIYDTLLRSLSSNLQSSSKFSHKISLAMSSLASVIFTSRSSEEEHQFIFWHEVVSSIFLCFHIIDIFVSYIFPRLYIVKHGETNDKCTSIWDPQKTWDYVW